MKQRFDFDEIRPFYDEEVPETIQSLLKEPDFLKIIKVVLPNIELDIIKDQLSSIKSIREFQLKFIIPFLNNLADCSTTSLDISGLENINKNDSYTLISNHRDIIMDAAFLNLLLYKNNFESCEVAIGNNLLVYPWIKNLAKLNKNFIVIRDVSVRKILEVSKRLSSYIHFAIKIKNNSVWIAQREGRSKDSTDKTQESLLKMLSMGGNNNFLKNIQSLNIAPVAISYEYDPCDYLKAQEFQLKRDDPEYKKSANEDLLSMKTGMYGFKGHVHFQVAKPINTLLKNINEEDDKAEIIAKVTKIIDQSIHLNYKLYPCNYIAFDILNETSLFSNKYSEEGKKAFVQYLQKQIDKIQISNKDETFIFDKLIFMYSNPLKNYLIARGDIIE